MGKTLKLSPPYVIQYNKVKAYFDGDPDINISALDCDSCSATISTENKLKYIVLRDNLITDYTPNDDDEQDNSKFLKLTVAYTGPDRMTSDELAALMATNPRFAYLFSAKAGPFPFSCVVFKNGVVQYPNDNIFDPHKKATTTMEALTKEIFKSHDFVSTDIVSEDF